MYNSQEKKEFILSKAATFISRKGYHGTGIQEILEACSIPKGSFYHYFPAGKEQLAADLAVYAYETMEKGIKKNLFSTSNNADEVFSRMAHCLSERVLANDDMMPSFLMTFLGLESIYIGPRITEACQSVYKRWQELYRDKLIECGYNESMAEEVALTCFTLVHGAMISSWIKQDNADLLKMEKIIPIILPRP